MTIKLSEIYCGALRLPVFLEPTFVYRKGTVPALKDGLSLLALSTTSKHLHTSCYFLSNYPMSHKPWISIILSNPYRHFVIKY